MELKCKKNEDVYWGSLLTEGKSYVVTRTRTYTTTLITDEANYWKHTKVIAGAIEWIRKGYDQDTLHEVIPGYLTMRERDALYTKEVEILEFIVTTDDGNSGSYCATTIKELLDKYGSCKFNTSIYFVEDYFDTTAELRNQAINKITE